MRSDADMEKNSGESDSRGAQKLLLEQIVALPAILYFPSRIVAELYEICETFGRTPEQLVIEALKSQLDYWDQFYQYVMSPQEEPEDFIWPADPMLCLAYVTTVHFIDSFAQCIEDPTAFKQLKEQSPAEWSFSSFEESDELDAADWWKEPD